MEQYLCRRSDRDRFRLSLVLLRQVLAEVLKDKSADAVQASAAGLEFRVKAAAALNFGMKLAPAPSAPRWFITGNEAVGMGALRGGVRFVACYPITPATDLVEWLAPKLEKLGGV